MLTVTLYTDDTDWTVTLSGGDSKMTGVPVFVYNGRRGRICESEFNIDKSLPRDICQKLSYDRGKHDLRSTSMR